MPPGQTDPGPAGPDSIRLKLVGAAEHAPPVGRDRFTANVNYLYGSDADKWLTDVPQYAAIEYKGVYGGIDLVFHGKQGTLEYDFVVKPGADPRIIRVAVESASGLEITPAGDLAITAGSGRRIVHKKPAIYQIVGERNVPVHGSFKLIDEKSYSFDIGRYNPAQVLIIDPVIYATPMPAGPTSSGSLLQVDQAGYVYIAGLTHAPNFPTTANAIQRRCGRDLLCGGYDNEFGNIFLLKLDPNASSKDVIIYSTYIPATSVRDFKVDRQGIMYLLGGTRSPEFPTTPNAFDNRCVEQPVSSSALTVCRIDDAGVVVKIDPKLSGKQSLLYSTYFPIADVIRFDASGNIYVAGRADSTTFPVTEGAFDSQCGFDAFCDRGQGDAFFAKFDPSAPAARSLAYSTLVGNVGSELDVNLHVSEDGALYFLLSTPYDVQTSPATAIPTTPNAIASNKQGFGDIYIGVLRPEGRGLADLKFGTFLGGQGIQNGSRHSLAVDKDGIITVAVESPLAGMPVTPNIVPGASQRTTNVYILQLDPSRANPVLFGTYLGGNGFDSIRGVAVDRSGFIYVLVTTPSSDLPTRGAFYFGCGGGNVCGDSNWYLAKLDPRRQDPLVYSTYGGGAGNDGGQLFFVDDNHNVFVSVQTDSATLPVTEGRSERQDDDGYIIKVRTNSSGSDSIAYATFVGGSFADSISDFVPDSQGRIHVIGITRSDDLPFSPNAIGTLYQQSGGFYMLLASPN